MSKGGGQLSGASTGEGKKGKGPHTISTEGGGTTDILRVWGAGVVGNRGKLKIPRNKRNPVERRQASPQRETRLTSHAKQCQQGQCRHVGARLEDVVRGKGVEGDVVGNPSFAAGNGDRLT